MSDLDHLGWNHRGGNHTDHGLRHDPDNFVLDSNGFGSCPNGNTGNCGLHVDSPRTPNKVSPDISFDRQMNMWSSQTMNTKANGNVSVPMFSFSGGGFGGGGFGGGGGVIVPNPLIRVKQGQIVHTNVTTGIPHTIHHHGIEPSTHNDGVGHYSFDVGFNYTYQWRPSSAGTFFYHCHVNTVLHAEMGMYGALIVDPPSGPGTAWDGGPAYDVEAIWAVDEFDTSWHCRRWNAGLCGGDAGFNDFNPDVFVINGIGDAETETHSTVAVSCDVGQRVLVRYIMAGYVPQRLTIEGAGSGLGDIQVIAEDGHPLPVAETLPVSKGKATPAIFTAAERREFYFTPTATGTYNVKIEFLHWITGNVLGIVETKIYVDEPGGTSSHNTDDDSGSDGGGFGFFR